VHLRPASVHQGGLRRASAVVRATLTPLLSTHQKQRRCSLGSSALGADASLSKLSLVDVHAVLSLSNASDFHAEESPEASPRASARCGFSPPRSYSATWSSRFSTSSFTPKARVATLTHPLGLRESHESNQRVREPVEPRPIPKRRKPLSLPTSAIGSLTSVSSGAGDSHPHTWWSLGLDVG